MECVTPTALEVAYLAGFIDGEGSICIWDRRSTWHSLRLYSLRLEVDNIDPDVIRFAQSRLGGSVCTRPISPRRRQTLYHLCVPSKRCLVALKLLLPHLIVKRAEAALAIEFQERFFPPSVRKWPRVTPERAAALAEYQARLSALRRPGVRGT